MTVKGFRLSEGGESYTNDDMGIEVWSYTEDGTTKWAFSATVLGSDVEQDGYPYSALAAMASMVLVPTGEQARTLVRQVFDSMSDAERLSLVQELNFEHGSCFEWSEVMPIADFLEGLSKDELVRVAVFGDLHNEIDPVRYDKYGDAEQVSYDELYSEVCENEDEILDVLIGVLEQGLSIYCTNYFDQLGDAIADGTWRDWMDDDEVCERQEV